MKYSQDLNTQHFEVQITNGSVLERSVLAIAIAMVPAILKLNHWKSEQNEGHFVQISNGFGQNKVSNMNVTEDRL